MLPAEVPGQWSPVAAPDFRMHVRMDDRSVLGIVGKDYKPVPNQVLASFADSLVTYDPGAAMETAGSLRGGKRVFSLVRLGEPVRISGGDRDELVPYLLVTNCHDGTGAFRAYFTTVRVVCANTHRWAEAKAGSAGFWYRHDGDIQGKVEEARRVLGLAANQTRKAGEQARFLSSVSLVQHQVDAYFQEVYNQTFGKRPAEVKAVDLAVKYPEKSPVEINALLASIDTKALDEYDEKREKVLVTLKQNHEADSARGTAWGAYNAVSYYHDHQRGRGEPQLRKLTDARVHSNLFGASAADKQKAMVLAVAAAKDA